MSDDLETIDRAFELALVDGDVDMLIDLLADDFTYVHGDAWTRGDPPMRVDDKATTIQAARDGTYEHRTTGGVTVELHGGVGIVEGSYHAGLRTSKRVVEFSVRYIRIYARKGDRWTLTTHRTVEGPIFD